MTSFVLGIDIGMSYTAAAIGRPGPDDSMVYEPLELGTRKAAVPTVVYLGTDGGVVVGEPAERRAMEHPHHVVREFKRRIGDETPMIVGDLSVTAEDIFAVLAAWVVERAEEHEGTAPEVIAISHPASWGDHRLGLIRAALAGVGLANVELVSEPEAAGLHYLVREKVDTGQTIAVYDLGGGTFDVALLRKHEDGTFRVVGAPTGIERLGGADFDQQIFDHVRSLASEAFDDVDELVPDAALALARVRRECTDAKEALSFDAETFVPVLLPGTQTRVRLVRSEFEQMIDDSLRRTVETLRCAVADAALELDDLSTVLLIGGSSRIPAVSQLISSELELPVAIDSDPKASISLGAAVAAARLVEPIAIDDEGAGSAGDASTDAVAQVLGAAPAGVRPSILERHHISIGLRATVLAGVAAAVLAILIPISPLAMGTQEDPGEDGGSTSQEGVGAPAGRYVTGAAPEALTDSPLITPVVDDSPFTRTETTPDAAPTTPHRPVSPANDGISPSTSEPPASSEPSASSGDGGSASEPSTSTDPVSTPDPTPDPAPDPTPDPAPDPVQDPAPDPVPEPTPEPAPDPVQDPAVDPAPEPTEPPSSTP